MWGDESLGKEILGRCDKIAKGYEEVKETSFVSEQLQAPMYVAYSFSRPNGL